MEKTQFLDLLEHSSKSTNSITEIIRKRRSVYADEFFKKDIPDKLLIEILTNGSWAPTHKMTEPWRFVIFKNEYLDKLGLHLFEFYKKHYYSRFPKEIAKEKCDFLRTYPLKSACVVGIVLTKHKKANLPEWEEVAAVSAAVQNIALSCTAHNLGSYWSTPEGAINFIEKHEPLKDNEKSLGLLYIGYFDQLNHKSTKKRTPIEKKITWFT